MSKPTESQVAARTELTAEEEEEEEEEEGLFKADAVNEEDSERGVCARAQACVFACVRACVRATLCLF